MTAASRAHSEREVSIDGYPPPLAISPSGRTVAAGLPDGGVRLHDARTLRRLRDLPGIENRPVAAVEFSPGGRSIAVTGLASTVELRDVATGRRMRPPLRLGAPAQTLAFSPDGDRLAVAEIDGDLRLLDLGSGKVRRGPRLAGFAAHLSYSPDGGMLIGRRRKWHRAARRSVSPARGPPSPARRRRRLVGSLLAGWPAAGRHLPALHAALGRGQAPAHRPAAEGPRRCGVHVGVLARRPDARDEPDPTAA